jgi:hopanoid biosynthesis associated protein HpnK
MPVQLIVTADDFGIDVAVNDAVESAYSGGILTSASLMVGGPALADAVERAKRLPGLKVGLHLAVVDAAPMLPRNRIPDLLGPDGKLVSQGFRSGVSFYFRPHVREQLRCEIRAQYEAFAATGLELDHVDVHKHMHLHPTVANELIAIGRDFGLRAVRVPIEPLAPLRAADPSGELPVLSSRLLTPWIRLLQRRVRRAGLVANDCVFGTVWSGRMTEERIVELLPRLNDGVNEIYFHPRAEALPGETALSPQHGNAADLAALTSPEVRRAIDRCGIELTAYGALVASRDRFDGRPVTRWFR